MITKEEALQVALQVIPDLQNRFYKIKDKLSVAEMFNNLPENCWYLIYSPVTVNYASCSPGRNLYLCIDKDTGEIKK